MMCHRFEKCVQLFCCMLLLLPVVLLRAHGAHKIDGVIGRTEYKEPMIQLISSRYESNNDVSLAYLFWDISAEDYSIYVAVKYMCDDVGVLLEKLDNPDETEPAQTEPDAAAAIELSVNGEVCAAAFLDGSFPGLDADKYDAESFFSFARSTTGKPDTNNFVTEIRLGLKYWMPHDSTLGIRIYDCKGRPSNLYTVTINPAPTTQSTTQSETVQETKPGSTVSSTTITTTTTTPKTTRRVITAAKAAVRITTVTETVKNTDSTKTKPEKVPKTTKPKPSKPEITQAGTTHTPITETTTSAQALSRTESTTAAVSEESASAVLTPAMNAANAIRLNRLRTVGIVLGTILLTSAALISILFGVRAREKNALAQNEEKTKPSSESNVSEQDDF